MTKLEVYSELKEMRLSRYDMVLINDDKILTYKDIDDDTLGLIDFDEDEETEYFSFELVKEIEDSIFEKEDGTVIETKTFNPFSGMIIGYKVI